MNTRTLYRLDTSRINASFILDVLRNGFPKAWKRFTNLEEEGETSESLAMGTLVHNIFENKVKDIDQAGYKCITEMPKSVQEEKLCLLIAETLKKEQKNSITSDVLQKAYETTYKTVPNKEKQKERIAALSEYILVLKEGNENKLIKRAFYYKIKNIINYVNSNFLFEKLIYSDEYLISKREIIVMWKYKTIDGVDVDCKSIIDRLILVDNVDNYVVILLDYKTHGKSNSEFEKSFQYWDYDIQAEFYEFAVKSLIKRLINNKTLENKPITIIPLIMGVSFYDESVELFQLSYTKGKLHNVMSLVNEHLKNKVFNETLISWKTRKQYENGVTDVSTFLIENLKQLKQLRNDTSGKKV